jgi:hypothetical protein
VRGIGLSYLKKAFHPHQTSLRPLGFLGPETFRAGAVFIQFLRTWFLKSFGTSKGQLMVMQVAAEDDSAKLIRR